MQICWNETNAEYTTKRKRTVRKRFFNLNRHGPRETGIYVSRETYMPVSLATQKKLFLINQREEKSYTQKQEELSALFFSFRKKSENKWQTAPYDISWTQSLRGLSVGVFKTHWHKHPIHRLVLRALETGEWLSAFKK